MPLIPSPPLLSLPPNSPSPHPLFQHARGGYDDSGATESGEDSGEMMEGAVTKEQASFGEGEEEEAGGGGRKELEGAVSSRGGRGRP